MEKRQINFDVFPRDNTIYIITPCPKAIKMFKILCEIKKVAVDLLDKIKNMLESMSNPFDNPTAKATIIVTIRDMLWSDLPESYSDESINYYKDAVYNYVSQRYGGAA